MAHPHTNLFRKTCENLHQDFHRAYGDIARKQATPTKAKASAASLKGFILEGFQESLAKTEHPLLDAENLAPDASGWLLQPMCGEVNLWRTHGPIAISLLMLNNGEATWGGIWMPLNSPDTRQDMMIVEQGRCAMWDTRLRMGAKSSEELDALILTDTAQAAANKHFRTTGCRIADMISVCAGIADGLDYKAEATPLEAKLYDILWKESGATL